ncbi:Bifunctional methylenetetrahydrofolate dehydrogenase/methenyltetrahydrofolate cyclohydrolase [Armadillidium vulgare]|nr:Bifunctional methylenetetrahydrofolate dehydrogenase/methenyltetrahydrofolate cyclohydrolase [Armadillidium vulgare]
MIVTGILGMSIKFAEVVLAFNYRSENTTGGAFYYMEHGLAKIGFIKTGKSLAFIYVIMLLVAMILGGIPFQANQIAALSNNLFEYNASVIISLLVLIVILGGIKRIAFVATGLGPIMIMLYVSMCVYLICANGSNLLNALSIMFQDIFNKSAIGGGVMNGKKIANGLCEKLSQKIDTLKREHNIFPCLKVILVGSNPASQVYVRNKQKKAGSIGISSETIVLPNNISEDELIEKINELNEDRSVHGILVQLPLPNHISASRVINAVSIEKDVDGFHNENVGRLVKGEKNCLIPCTPKGSLHLIKSIEENLSGKNAVIIGRSNIVGKPMFHLLLQENCTVTILHSQSKDYLTLTKQATLYCVIRLIVISKTWQKLLAENLKLLTYYILGLTSVKLRSISCSRKLQT